MCLLFYISSIDSFHAFYFLIAKVLRLLKELSAHIVLTHFMSYVPGLTTQVYFHNEIDGSQNEYSALVSGIVV